MAGRADRAERVLGAAVQHQVGGGHRGAGGAQRGLAGVRAGRGVGVDGHQRTGIGHPGERLVELAQVVAGMRMRQVQRPRRRRVVVAQQHVGQAGGQEVVLDGVQPGRRFGMAGAHVVTPAIGVAEESRGHARPPARSAVGPGCLGSVVLILLSPLACTRCLLFGYRRCHDLIVANASDKAEKPD